MVSSEEKRKSHLRGMDNEIRLENDNSTLFNIFGDSYKYGTV